MYNLRSRVPAIPPGSVPAQGIEPLAGSTGTSQVTASQALKIIAEIEINPETELSMSKSSQMSSEVAFATRASSPATSVVTVTPKVTQNLSATAPTTENLDFTHYQYQYIQVRLKSVLFDRASH